jgi:starch synthase
VAGVDVHSTLALGILYADAVNTVSQTYAREILTPEYGEGLDPVLRHRADRLFGIQNGIEVDVFDPRHDRRIEAHYSADDPGGKAANTRALCREAGLEAADGVPLVGMVTRLFDQKGLDLVAEVLPGLVEQGALQFVLLGSGEERYERFFADLARRFPRRVAAFLKFDAALAERIYAGADLFLMPSRFEPGGLGQLIALRYGTVPVVRATGGLADTVQDLSPTGDDGTGFAFRDYSAAALRGALDRALDAFRNPALWRGLVQRDMRRDVSWDASARRYETLYRQAAEFHAREVR